MTLAATLAQWSLTLPRWWMAELDALLPDALRSASSVGLRERLIMAPGEDALSLALLDGDGHALFEERTTWSDYTRTMLDACRRRAAALLNVGDVSLSISLPQAVSRTMLIPWQARGQAMQIVRDHIASRIPLPLDEIVIGLDIQAAEAGKLSVNFMALPRTLLERTLERLGLGASEVALIENGTTAAIPLAGPKPASASRRARLVAASALAAVLAALAGFSVTAYRQGAVLGTLDEDLRLTERPMQEIAQQTRAVAKLSDDLATFGRWRSAPGINRIWEELAEILPSTTYLTELEINQTGLQLSGFSVSTPELIRFLEGSAVIEQAVLSSPITFDQAKGRDRFSVQASLKQARGPLGTGG